MGNDCPRGDHAHCPIVGCEYLGGISLKDLVEAAKTLKMPISICLHPQLDGTNVVQVRIGGTAKGYGEDLWPALVEALCKYEVAATTRPPAQILEAQDAFGRPEGRLLDGRTFEEVP
jgi:hypothetical protein|tara:strand:- start:25838 stop:26188 length:351 start_codon:yes stop_codon:yes gene_type:complete